jgi:hypothetical protein
MFVCGESEMPKTPVVAGGAHGIASALCMSTLILTAGNTQQRGGSATVTPVLAELAKSLVNDRLSRRGGCVFRSANQESRGIDAGVTVAKLGLRGKPVSWSVQ